MFRKISHFTKNRTRRGIALLLALLLMVASVPIYIGAAEHGEYAVDGSGDDYIAAPDYPASGYEPEFEYEPEIEYPESEHEEAEEDEYIPSVDEENAETEWDEEFWGFANYEPSFEPSYVNIMPLSVQTEPGPIGFIRSPADFHRVNGALPGRWMLGRGVTPANILSVISTTPGGTAQTTASPVFSLTAWPRIALSNWAWCRRRGRGDCNEY